MSVMGTLRRRPGSALGLRLAEAVLGPRSCWGAHLSRHGFVAELLPTSITLRGANSSAQV